MPRELKRVPRRIGVIIGDLIGREGGFVDDPDDSGGATNMGITFKTLLTWDPEATYVDIQRLDRFDAIQIYYQVFWLPYMKYYKQGVWLETFMFDWYVHSGVRNTTRQLQRLVGAKPDGQYGPLTDNSVQGYFIVHKDQARYDVFHARVAFFFRIIKRRPKDAKFGPGWYNRVRSVL